MAKVNKTWKACESRAGVWLGAKGLKKSGRVPLSGSNSNISSSDTPHPTIYCEVKRAKKYLSAINLWEKYSKKLDKNLINIVTLPVVNDGKIISKTSNIWCFHNSDSELIYDYVINNKLDDLIINPWQGGYPSALTLYEETVATWKNSNLDKDKKVAHCAIFKHNKKGFWIIINKDHIQTWWPLVIEARANREKLIKEEFKNH